MEDILLQDSPHGRKVRGHNRGHHMVTDITLSHRDQGWHSVRPQWHWPKAFHPVPKVWNTLHSNSLLFPAVSWELKMRVASKIGELGEIVIVEMELELKTIFWNWIGIELTERNLPHVWSLQLALFWIASHIRIELNYA